MVGHWGRTAPGHHQGMQRTLVLVDVENLAGHITPRLLEPALAHILAPVTLTGPHDLVLGAQPEHADLLAQARPQALVVLGAGPNGVDHALGDAYDLLTGVMSYTHLVIVSGDHYFAPLAEHATAHGLSVEVVARTGTCARDLTEAATVVHEIPAVRAALAAARA